MHDQPAVREGVPGGPGVSQLLPVLPVAGPHPLVHHAAVVPRGVGEQPGGGVAQPLPLQRLGMLPANRSSCVWQPEIFCQ